MEIIIRALKFATDAHRGQKRKHTGEDYISHPKAVADLLWSVHTESNMIAAAWLHDVIEDTSVTIEEIDAEFGYDVAKLVAAVTDISRPEDGKRAARKRIDRQHIASASERAKTIKLADLIDNSRSIVEHDPHFAKVYMCEKAELLIDISRRGFETCAAKILYGMAADIVLDYLDGLRK